jgi:hypothetical protein
MRAYRDAVPAVKTGLSISAVTMRNRIIILAPQIPVTGTDIIATLALLALGSIHDPMREHHGFGHIRIG